MNNRHNRARLALMQIAAAVIPNIGALSRLCMGDAALRLAMDADPGFAVHAGWHRAPFGSSKNCVARDARQAAKRRAVKRARRLRHA